MRAEKVMFMAVSTITPQKEMMLVATTAPMTLRGLAWVALMNETFSGQGGIIGVQSDEIGQHAVESSQITLLEPAFHGCLLPIYISPHSCLQTRALAVGAMMR